MFFKSGLKQTYVLIHGAWHGSWCWKSVAPLLTAKGHRVITPDLPGHGKDNTQFRCIGLDTYVESVTDIIKTINTPVILVGHSMAGVVVSQVAEQMPQSIEKLIYLAAFVPSNGGSLVDEESQTKKPGVTNEVFIDQENCTISLKLSKTIRDLFYNNCSNEDASWAISQLQKQPLRPFLEPARLSNSRFGIVPKVYIECLKDAAVLLEDQRRMQKKIECDVISIDTDHSPFLSASSLLSDHLLNMALPVTKNLNNTRKLS